MPDDTTFGPRSGYRESFAAIREQNARGFGYDTSPISKGVPCISTINSKYSNTETPQPAQNLEKSCIEGDSTFRPLKDVLAEPVKPQNWLIDELFPAGSFSAITGRPKSGKSTLARNIAHGVATNTPVLGRDVLNPGPVLYAAFEGRSRPINDHFRAMGTNGPVFIHHDMPPSNPLEWLGREIETRGAVLVVLDTLVRLGVIVDDNSNSEVSRVLTPYIHLANQTGCTLLSIHHDGKQSNPNGDGMMGATAFFGSVDIALKITRNGHARSVSSIVREGEDMEKTDLIFDPERQWIDLGQTRHEALTNNARQAVLDQMGDAPSPLTQSEIAGLSKLNRTQAVSAINRLVADGVLIRKGTGRKGDPFRFNLA